MAIWSTKKGEVVDLFASEKEFVSDLYSMNQNFIQNDPMFNLELATKLRNPGVKTYGWTPSGDKSKLLSPSQRQKALDKLKEVMKHDTYQAQFAEDFVLEDGSLFKLTDDMFTIEKAEAASRRIGLQDGGKNSPRFKMDDKRQGILGSGPKNKTWQTELMEDLHPFRNSRIEIARTNRDLIDPIFKKKHGIGMNLMIYYKQFEEMDDYDMRDPEHVPSRRRTICCHWRTNRYGNRRIY